LNSRPELDNRASEGLFLGLISGTSMDGVDAALAHFHGRELRTEATVTRPYSRSLRSRLQYAIQPDAKLSLHEFATLDIEIGQHFADTALALLEGCGIGVEQVAAIGSHGQTLRHHASGPAPYSLQLGSPATIAATTGITTIADFRSLDVAMGGQGAPLVPPFHAWCFGAADESRAVVNIGGIANISLLPKGSDIVTVGFDTGPGNCLMDDWIQLVRGMHYDRDGAWAASGVVIDDLLKRWLADPYFDQAPPKSTGREYFNRDFIERQLVESGAAGHPAQDIQSTLCELSVETIARALDDINDLTTVLICGGGTHNACLVERLRRRLPGFKLENTANFGVDPDYVEACAFAWLASRRLTGQPVTLTSSARQRGLLLGAVYEPRVTVAGIPRPA
jgi:anhydro-N-acetylmuramic acid kinase